MAIKQIGIRQQGGGYTYSDIGANSANIDVPNGGSTQSLDAALLAINTEIDTNKTNTDAAIATKAAISHADATGTAGKGTATNFGHVKMGAGIDTAADGVVKVAYGTSANTACQGNDSRLSDKRVNPTSLTAGSIVYDGSEAKTITAATLGAAPTNHASTGTTYGVGDASNYGHVKAGTGITSTSGVLSTNYGTAAGTACQGDDSRLSNARTPVSHATSATTYGIGNTTNYGHVKVSDAYATSDGTASQGVSASSYAVNQAYNELNSKLPDWLVEASSNANGYYEKWNSGRLTMWNRISVNVAFVGVPSCGVMGEYYYVTMGTRAPITPVEVRSCLVNCYGSGVSWATRALMSADSDAISYTVIQYGAALRQHYIDWEVRGRWK